MYAISQIMFLSGIFASTNIDDLFLLVGFSSDKSLTPAQVIVGQFIGIGALIALSLAVALAALAISPALVGLLGVAPILIGLVKFRSAIRHFRDDSHETTNTSTKGLGALGVASVTIVSGGDNIGIYAPLFASQTRIQMFLTIAVFAVLTLVWCVAARLLVSHPTIAKPVRRIGPLVMPGVLIALGAVILYNSGAIDLATQVVGVRVLTAPLYVMSYFSCWPSAQQSR
jgi:cadmium resistance protein CadD (predicted permease)